MKDKQHVFPNIVRKRIYWLFKKYNYLVLSAFDAILVNALMWLILFAEYDLLYLPHSYLIYWGLKQNHALS